MVGNIGATWKKWDLHVHSPSSKQANGYPKKDGQPDWDLFIEELSKLTDVAVVGITDYFSIEGYKKIAEYQQDNKLTNIECILPNIEFRLDEKNKDEEHINLHIIFSNEIKDGIAKIDKFLSRVRLSNVTSDRAVLTCTSDDLDQIGYDKAVVKLDSIMLALKETFGDKKPYLVVGVANGYGGIRPPRNDTGRKSEIAKMIDQEVDLFFGRSTDREFFMDKIKFRYPGSKKKAVIQGSDARSIEGLKKWVGKQAEITTKDGAIELREITWLKADATFNGLSKALSEPDDRFFIGNEPPKREHLRLNKSNYISRVTIKGLDASARWFDAELDINPGLVAIIGKKGSGKSALADIIAHIAGSKVTKKNYSFLNDDRFLKNKRRAGLYEASVTWQDDTGREGPLTSGTLEDNIERVKYLPQKYVEQICDPLGVTGEFQREINSVIFSYVKAEDRLGAVDLDELIEYHSKVLNKEIISKRMQINDVNSLIVKLEDKAMPEYLATLNVNLSQKQQDLKNLEAPKSVQKPKNSLPASEQLKAAELQKHIKEVEAQIEKAVAELEQVNIKLRAVQNIKEQINLSVKSFRESVEKLSMDLELTGIDIDKVFSFHLDKKPILAKEATLSSRKVSLLNKLDRNDELVPEESLIQRKAEKEAELAKIFSNLDLKNKNYQAYVAKNDQYEKAKKLLEGDKADKTLTTINSIIEEINYVTTKLKDDLTLQYEERKTKVGELYEVISSKSKFYEEIYSPVIKKLDKEREEQRNAESLLDFKVNTVFEREVFMNSFLSSIHQGKQGSFQGTERGLVELKQLLDGHDLKTKDGIVAFLDDLMLHLSKDYQSKSEIKPATKPQDQLKVARLELYNLLFKIDFIDVKYSVLFNGKDLNENEFSPGEKGALLLIFYLLVDKSNTPLIIDQPEENLDNESVFQLLVPYIKAAKRHRQVIIVTHNPNLAVVCDAEQIIHAEMDKRNETIRYSSGAIENKVINKKISNILEGTLEAFDVRHIKYFR